MGSLASEMQKVTTMPKNVETADVNTMDDRDLVYEPFQIGLDTDKVAVVIDGANIYNVTKELGINIDFKALSRILYANFPNLKGKYYITSEHIRKEREDKSSGFRQFEEGHSILRPLLDFLRFSRYTVISRPIEINDDSDRHQVDSSMDVEIVTTLFQVAKWAQHIVFFGSSKKFALPLRVIKESGITVTVVSTVKANNRSVADDLRKIDNFVDISDPFFVNLINNTRTRKSFIPGVGEYTLKEDEV